MKISCTHLRIYVSGQLSGSRDWGQATLVDVQNDITAINFDLLGPASLGSVSGTVSFPADVLSGLYVSVYSDTQYGQSTYFPISSGQSSIDYTVQSLTPAADYYVAVYPQGGLQHAYYSGSSDGTVDDLTRNYFDRTLLIVRACKKITLHFERRCIPFGCVALP